MIRAKKMVLAGWGNSPSQAADVFRPEKISEVRSLATDAKQTLIPRGLGRSYGDAALNENHSVLLETQFDRLLAFDPATGVLECEGGVSFEDLLQFLLPRGYFLPVTPGTKFVTVGGAIAADVHGKNHHRDGSIANFVEQFDLLIADGTVLTCSRTENTDAFWATLGGMGLTGVILSARMKMRKVTSAYLSVDYQKAPNLDAALELFARNDKDYEYSVAWIDCLARHGAMGRSVLMRANHAKMEEMSETQHHNLFAPPRKKKRAVPFYLPGLAVSPMSVRLFNHFYYKQPPGWRLADYDSFFYPLDAISNWNRGYGRRGFFQYQAVFPLETARACLMELLEKLSSARSASFLAVLKTMGPASGGMLSFPMPGQTLALDIPNRGTQTVDLLRQLDAIVLRHGGRVYLAKDACMTAESFRAMYPRAGEFEKVKASLDPQNRFSSSLSRRLGIGARA